MRNVLGLSAEVNFEVGETVWGVRRWGVVSGDGEGGLDEGTTQGDASALVRAWWGAWAPVVRDAVLARRRGVVGVEDWMVAQMGWREKEVGKDWGVDHSS